MAYSKESDLLVGDITYDTTTKTRMMNAATNEINAAIGFRYTIPLSPNPSGHIALLLQRIETLIASGRIILDAASASEHLNLHSYGASLLREGQDMLRMIQNGEIDLPGYGALPSKSTGDGPTIIQGDTFSGVDAFYAWQNEGPSTLPRGPGSPPIWQPGVYDV